MLHLCLRFMYSVVMVGQMILLSFQNLIQQKIQEKVKGLDDDDEKEIKIGAAPTWFLCFVGCCLFSFIAVILGCQTDNYVENVIRKHPDCFLLLI